MTLKFSFAHLMGRVQYRQLYPAQYIVRPWPANLHEQWRAFFAKNKEYYLPPSWLLVLREVSITWEGVVFHGLHFYPETLVFPNWPKYSWRDLLNIRLQFARQRLSDVKEYVLIHDSWSESYYHWLVDALPRLLAMHGQLANKVLLLPETYNQDYHHKTLAALGVVSIERLKSNTRYVVPNLIVPTRLARVASYNPVVMRELRQILLIKFPLLPQANLGDRIYISRARAPRRRVLNEAEITTCLREQDFAIVQLEDYSFADQVSIMTRARYLVSIHGAGLTNMLFMAPSSKVLELQMQDDGTNHYYYTLAADLGIEYYYQFCSPSDPALTVQDADLTVDVAELKQIVAQMLVN